MTLNDGSLTRTAPLMTDVVPPAATRLGAALRDVLAMIRRNLLHIAREPEQLGDVTLQPILFTLLFVYVFGSAVGGTGISYVQFVIPGLLVMNLTTSSMGTAVGLTSDVATGFIDRLRTLPMWAWAVLTGRSVTDLLTATICAVIVILTGLVVGWTPPGNLVALLEGLGIALLFAYALSWLGVCVGLLARSAESAQAFGFMVLFPLTFISNALVPTVAMPELLRTFADWNPVSAVTAAVRLLWGDPNPSLGSLSWSMQNPAIMALAWSIAILAICVPVATVLFRRRTTD
jgi:ABC-2 type transport system permease protein